jgi:hypothetical protein
MVYPTWPSKFGNLSVAVSRDGQLIASGDDDDDDGKLIV